MKSLEKFLAGLIAAGALLLAVEFLTEADISFWLWAFVVVGFLFFSTYALKLFTNVETQYLVSLVRTKRCIGFITWISRFRLWDLLADIGLVFGFGTIAVDFLYARKFSGIKRLIVDIFGFLLLFGLFFPFIWGLMLFRADGMGLSLFLSLSFAFGGMMLFAIAALVWQAYDIFAKLFIGKKPCPGVAPVIPGVQIPNVPFVPPLYVWGVFLVILVIHEFSHGAMIRRANAKIKSVGLLLAGILPIGAFVEPNDEEINSKLERQQMRIFAMGPAANLFSIPVFLVIFLLIATSISAVAGPRLEELQTAAEIESVTINKVIEEYDICGNGYESAAFGKVEEGWEIIEYNGFALTNLQMLGKAIASDDKNVTLLLRTDSGEIVERELIADEKTALGFQISRNSIKYVEGKEPADEFYFIGTSVKTIEGFFNWLLLLSFAVAVFNFLPLAGLDGARIAKIMLVPYFGFMQMNKEETQKFIGRLFLWVIAGLLLLNFWPILL